VKGALVSRNSFLGLAGDFGAIKLGKTDAPYKLSTGRMDPFSASVGDYNSIMGNTGGDNRAEFDTRISHAVWYESPKMGAVSFSALLSPNQNRSTDNINVPSGEPNCNGGNPPDCTDGSNGNIYSLAGVYAAGPVYAIVAYEMHKKVNRTGDENGGTVPVGAVGIADEHAIKAGVQYKFPSNTTLNFILEKMVRDAPNPNFNERERTGFWLALTQKMTAQDDLNVGLAHAGKSPGTPGATVSDGTTVTGSVDNAANMLSLGYKHHFADKQTTWYAVYARQANHDAAHYDLGASGHGITTDCHDAAGNCFAGATVTAVSVGMTYNF
ncbi:MAG: porin, partial [Burkholderiales bacterium]